MIEFTFILLFLDYRNNEGFIGKPNDLSNSGSLTKIIPLIKVEGLGGIRWLGVSQFGLIKKQIRSTVD